MMPVLLVLLLAVVLFGIGFVVKALWWIALAVLVVWLLGFLFHRTGATGRRTHWYRW
ncbi:MULTISPECIES: hydrophobic protein [Streptomyces]|uniref:Hydrophobic protein n=1 Tax=Streptomyces lonegramiae TaxID=3075524 RepID=A0ABU2XGI9_9ACTN|nr:hydrophobic protein [Streptomyces sp. DSM 41529]MDT0544620.1 hydrophobic protein [Streptomyces sp. DSM 41529]